MKKDKLFWFYPFFYLVVLFVVIKFNGQDVSEQTAYTVRNSNATKAEFIQTAGENRNTINYLDIKAVPLIITNKKCVAPIYFWYRDQPGAEAPADTIFSWFAVNSDLRSPDAWRIPLKNNSDKPMDSAGIEELAESVLNGR